MCQARVQWLSGHFRAEFVDGVGGRKTATGAERAISTRFKRLLCFRVLDVSCICERKDFIRSRLAERTEIDFTKLTSLLAACGLVAMITKHITEVITKFNPFTKPAKTCRIFLAHLPANARTTMKINATVLKRDSQEPSFLKLKFSTCFAPRCLVPYN